MLHALSFAPTVLWWLQILSFTGLCLLAITQPQRAGLIAWMFGLGTFTAGLSWMFISMHRFGGMPAPMAALAVLLLSAYLALFGAAATQLAIRIANVSASRSGAAVLSLPLALAACWILAEMARGLALSGFPWLSIGYAHVDGPFSGMAAWIGVYGIAGTAVLVSALLAQMVHDRFVRPGKKAIGQNRQSDHPPGMPVHYLFALPGIIAAIGLSIAAGQKQFASAAGDPISIRLLQGNVEQQLKFDPQRTLRAMHEYVGLIEQGTAQLYVLPETAWTVDWSRTPATLLDAISRHLNKNAALLATGMPLRERSTSGTGQLLLANSVLTINGRRSIVARYDKRHLVPFGEFIPPGFRWFIRMMKVPLGDFSRGLSNQPQLGVSGRQIAFNICYEDLFGEELATQVRSGANLLINVSNIGWFGQSHALPQHLNISRMRAMEFQRPMLRSTNTGVTAHISVHGEVLARLPDYQQGALDVLAQPMTGLTPYARYGLWLPGLLALLMLLAARLLAPAVRSPDLDGKRVGKQEL